MRWPLLAILVESLETSNYEELSTQQLRMELEKRAMMDYPADTKLGD